MEVRVALEADGRVTDPVRRPGERQDHTGGRAVDMSLPTWLHRIGEHAVLLLAVMPLLGAGLVLCVARAGPDVVRRIALINSGLCVVIALLMLACGYRSVLGEAAGGASRLVVRVPWVGFAAEVESTRDISREASSDAAEEHSHGIELAIGIDGLSLWPAALTVFAVWALLIVQPRGESGGLTALMLLCESSLIGVFAARDVVLLCVCLAGTAILAPLCAGRQGGEGRRAPVRRLMFQQLAGAAAFTMGLAGCVAAHTVMGGVASQSLGPPVWDLDGLIGTIRETSAADPLAGVVWRQLSPWVFLALLGGCVLTTGVFPMQASHVAAHARAGTAGRVLLHLGSIGVGSYLLLRIVLPMCQTVSAQLAPPLIALAFGGMMFTAAWLQRAADTSRAWAGLAQILAGLIFAGALTFAPAGLRGAGWLVTAACGLLPLLHIAGDADRSRRAVRSSAFDGTGDVRATPFSGGLQRAACVVSAAALFPGLLLVTIAFAELDAWFLGGWLISMLLIGGIGLLAGIACTRDYRGSAFETGDEFGGDWRFALLPLMAAAIFIALFPHVVLDGIDATLGEMFGGPSSDGA